MRNGREFCPTLHVTVPAAAWPPLALHVTASARSRVLPVLRPAPSLKLLRPPDFQRGQRRADTFFNEPPHLIPPQIAEET
jgi:hypothetical protein